MALKRSAKLAGAPIGPDGHCALSSADGPLFGPYGHCALSSGLGCGNPRSADTGPAADRQAGPSMFSSTERNRALGNQAPDALHDGAELLRAGHRIGARRSPGRLSAQPRDRNADLGQSPSACTGMPRRAASACSVALAPAFWASSACPEAVTPCPWLARCCCCIPDRMPALVLPALKRLPAAPCWFWTFWLYWPSRAGARPCVSPRPSA
jgi:hypothetical protein